LHIDFPLGTILEFLIVIATATKSYAEIIFLFIFHFLFHLSLWDTSMWIHSTSFF